jgi:cold shock CspA family protein
MTDLGAADAATVSGVVETFDAAVGLGTIRTTEGVVVPFHCIAIADGTRTIEVATTVQAVLVPKLGRYEAAAIRPV